jgi:ABC-type dipeptide/oligopeptide/nickel transport system permease subunit
MVGVGRELPAILSGTAIDRLGRYSAGWLDSLLMRVTDVVMAFPPPRPCHRPDRGL